MPLYEYQCEACANRFEKIVQFSDPPIEICPVCGGKVRKLFSSPAIQFKGSGFYINDYAKKLPADASSGGKSSTDKTSDASGDSSKSDTWKSDTSKSEASKSDTSKAASSKSEASASTTAASGSTTSKD